MRQVLLILASIFWMVPTLGHSLHAQVAGIDTSTIAVAEQRFRILSAYLRGRSEAFSLTPLSVQLCWPVKDSIQVDEGEVRAWVREGIVVEFATSCGSIRSDDRLNIWRIEVAGDTARVEASRVSRRPCLGLGEDAELATRWRPEGRTDAPRRDRDWTLRQIIHRVTPAKDCVVITPTDSI